MELIYDDSRYIKYDGEDTKTLDAILEEVFVEHTCISHSSRSNYGSIVDRRTCCEVR